MNDTALAIPYAIKAGLGEYGRHQMVITPEFGPRVRFSKIFTSLSLKPDQAKKFRITEYCNECTKCSDACPPKALPYGKPTFGTDSPSTIQGIKKWSANCEKCFDYWAKLRSDCAICMRVCPFNRDFSKLGSKIFRLIATSRLQPLALWWEKKVTRFKRIKPDVWWNHHLK
jgi:epoxyqueuosine reductase QueG